MTSTPRRLLAEALALPEDERLELTSELLASVDGPPEPDWERAWADEIHRRVENANVLVYATNSAAPQHVAARRLHDQALAGEIHACLTERTTPCGF
jgi:hypothetical protein